MDNHNLILAERSARFKVNGILDNCNYYDTRIEIGRDEMTIAQDRMVHDLAIFEKMPPKEVVRNYRVFFLGEKCSFVPDQRNGLSLGYLQCPALFYHLMYLGWEEGR